ncbi:hypothetical protein ACFYUY_08545 [Kitasatospora sp. NPDC004745]|uniref:hypothetical protein n=1 Tax=unclassified Kitasatospora TaxID=2633591 RepID=UPI003403890B
MGHVPGRDVLDPRADGLRWRLEPLDDGRATRITARVDLPPQEAHRLGTQTEVVETSLTRLADLVARS